MPALGAAAVDRLVQLAVRVEFVHAQQGDVRIFGVARAFRRVRRDMAETAAVAQELGDRQVLAGHHQNIVVEPCLIDRREPGIVERPDIDATDFHADLRPHLADLNHGMPSWHADSGHHRPGAVKSVASGGCGYSAAEWRTTDEYSTAMCDDSIPTRRSRDHIAPFGSRVSCRPRCRARSIAEILDAAARAPSGTNMQPWRGYVLIGAPRDELCAAVQAVFDAEEAGPSA